MEIYLIGVNHKTADVEIREQVAFSGDGLTAALRALSALPVVQETFILSTCNRTELYVVAPAGSELFPQLERVLSELSGFDVSKHSDYFYRYLGSEAVRHLFRVASGLDSQIIGEPQILGQLKDAYRLAVDQRTTGILFNRLLNHSFTVGKRVRNETALGVGAVSVAYAAVELSQKIFRHLSRRKALVIGAGETGALVARHLHEKGVGHLYIANRTLNRAQQLAEELGGTALPLNDLNQFIDKADIIVGAVTAPDFILTYRDLKQKDMQRRQEPVLMVDIGVPRNFEPKLGRLETVFLHGLDDLEQIVEVNLARRRQEIPQALKIIDEEISKFYEWKKSLQVAPTIVSLREKFEEIRRKELEKYRHKLSDAEFDKLNLVSRALMNKYLHLPTVQIRKYGNGRPDGMLRLDVIREMFGLGEEEDT